MVKIVDNLLDKLDQFKRKVMTDTEAVNENPEESSSDSVVNDKTVDSKESDSEAAGVKAERKPQGKSKNKGCLNLKRNGSEVTKEEKQ